MRTVPVCRRTTAGFSLIEMMIALIMMGIVMTAAISVMRSQSKNFRVGGTKMELAQNIRFAISTVDRVVRTAGSGTSPSQPMLVYADSNVVVINANYAADIQDGNAVYINPDLPAGAVNGLTTTTPITIPYTGINYPFANYFWAGATPSRAETIEFFFRPDSTTADTRDYILFQRVNAMGPELVARNIRHYPNRAFFEYFTENTDNVGNATIQQVTYTRNPATQRLPVYHSSDHGAAGDQNNSALADSIRLVRINMVVSNGLTNADSSSRQVSTTMSLPNNGLVQLTTCGDVPVLNPPLVAINTTPQQIELQWFLSPDELTGERDVLQYNIYYKPSANPNWSTFATQAAAGLAQYDFIKSLPAGTYDFAVGAQDCTPSESGLIIIPNVIVLP